jgi:signal transduction histidine kinase
MTEAGSRPLETVNTFPEPRAPGEAKRSSPCAEPTREQLRALIVREQRLLEAQQKKIACEIHNELGQTLTTLAFELATLDQSLDGPEELADTPCLRQTVKRLSGLVDGLMRSAQRMMADLRPKVLDEFGLVAALAWQSQLFRLRNGIRCQFSASSVVGALEPATEIDLFRLTQDILSNVTRHAKASRVEIQVEQRPDRLVVEVRDNGQGITQKEVESPDSLGLLSMRERVSRLGGELRISGRPARGTTVTVTIPAPPASVQS